MLQQAGNTRKSANQPVVTATVVAVVQQRRSGDSDRSNEQFFLSLSKQRRWVTAVAVH